jgi:sec-independent protein translocase protein TatC
MPVLEHLAELRRRLFICAGAIVVAATVCFFFSNQVIAFLLHFLRAALHDPHKNLQVLSPLDAFVVRLKIATYGGIVLALPIWLYEVWRFVTPGLNPKEKRYAVPFVLSALVLFALGALVAFLTLEPALHFLAAVGGPNQTPNYTSDKYVTLVALMIVAFGISFEFPLILVFLQIAHVLSPAQLRKARRWAIVGIFFFAAVITPSQDPYSLFFMAIPMCLFYEASILVGRMLKR